jgi:NAD+ synthase
MTKRHLIIAIAQQNYTVGDLEGNYEKMFDAYNQVSDKADLIAFAEASISGYSPEDLNLHPSFQKDLHDTILKLAAATKGQTCEMLVGGIQTDGGTIYNSAFLLADGKIKDVISKYDLPNYGVFDEKRVFTPPAKLKTMKVKGFNIGVMICADVWEAEVSDILASQGAELFIALSASPFDVNKQNRRRESTVRNSKKNKVPFIYINMVGGSEDVVFDGGSFAIKNDGSELLQMDFWSEDLGFVELKDKNLSIADFYEPKEISFSIPESKNFQLEMTYYAVMHGIRDYVNKNNFAGVIIGMSGGIDSALTAALAIDAIGPKKVKLVMLPSIYTSNESLKDASECSILLGNDLENVSIKNSVSAVNDSLKDLFHNYDSDSTEENIQARLRALTLMAISNKLGLLLLSTGNKSEIAVGYSTLYGDTCGGYSPIKDIYKTQIYQIAHWRNENFPINSLGTRGKVIPENIFTKPPTAELKEDQTDQDTLPPYDVLDKLLYLLIEKQASYQNIIKRGFDKEIIADVYRMVKRAEYKRKQSPPGPKISVMSFGKDRRYPIINKYKFIEDDGKKN